jgi:hypothetical protein
VGANPSEKYTVISRRNHPRGTLVINSDSDSAITYTYAILKSTQGLKLMLKPAQSDGPIEYFVRESAN